MDTNKRKITTAIAIAVAAVLTGCGADAAQQTAPPAGQDIAPVFILGDGKITRSTTTTTAATTTTTATSSSQLQTTPIMQINPDGSVTQTGTLVVTTLAPEELSADLSALQIEVINWRSFQRKASAAVHGETSAQSECIIETSIRALPEELLPELTNPAQAETQMSTVELWLEELELARAVCI